MVAVLTRAYRQPGEVRQYGYLRLARSAQLLPAFGVRQRIVQQLLRLIIVKAVVVDDRLARNASAVAETIGHGRCR